MSLKITFLGTGTSVGVPMLLDQGPVAQSSDPKDHRFRSSILIEKGEDRILIDCSPDFRSQLLKHPSPNIDAILFTHEHADHIAGLDDIRPYCFKQGPMPIYGLNRVIQALADRYAYIFRTENRYPGAPAVEAHQIEQGSTMNFGSIEVQAIGIDHGGLPILGYRIGDFAYLTDVKQIEEDQFQALAGVKTLVLSCIRDQPKHPTHVDLEEAIQIIERINPDITYFTHISHIFGTHEQILSKVPEDVFPAYDGLVLNLNM